MNEYMNAAVVMFKQLVAAATPIAVKAYEIGLLTLQIDAVSVIFPCFLLLFLACYIMYKVVQSAKADGIEDSGVFFGIVAVALGAAALCNLLNVWLWVKLFRPELWLAHVAIDKLVK